MVQVVTGLDVATPSLGEGGVSSLWATLELPCHSVPFSKLSPSDHPEAARRHSRIQGFQAD